MPSSPAFAGLPSFALEFGRAPPALLSHPCHRLLCRDVRPVAAVYFARRPAWRRRPAESQRPRAAPAEREARLLRRLGEPHAAERPAGRPLSALADERRATGRDVR